MFDFFVQNCMQVFYPGQNVTLDEGMFPFRRCVCFHVYIKNKPNKHDLKCYILNDAFTGYILNAEVYTGPDDNSANSISSLMFWLCSDYLGTRTHNLYRLIRQ